MEAIMEAIEVKLLRKLVGQYSLTTQEAYSLMERFLSGDFDPRFAASILSVIAFKGEHPDELTGFAKAMIDEMKKFNSPYDNLTDILGIGGDNKKVFNISTIACMILSLLDVKVAKQTRYSAKSKCGSADILKALGININADYEQKKLCLDNENITFMDMHDYCSVCEPIKNLQEDLGVYSILSMIPSLCHPAKVKRKIIGTPDRFRASLISKTLSNMETDKAYVLWNESGYDEIVPIGTTHVMVVEKGLENRELVLTANDFGLAGNYKSGTPIIGGTCEQNLQAFEEIDNCTPGIVFDTVIMNVSLGLRLTGVTKSLKEGTELVKSKIKKGMLKKKIQHLIKITNSI
jgi:anthranilate phosphoribosyltransferase